MSRHVPPAIGHEVLDLEAPIRIDTREELDAELARLRAQLPTAVIEAATERTVVPISGWRARTSEELPANPARLDESGFAPAEVPLAVTDRVLHLRTVVPSMPAPADTTAVLRLERPDYAATVFLDGVEVAKRRGYIGAIEVPYDPSMEHRIDVVIERARDPYRWSGESEGVNYGDAHGKGLGSVVGDAVTSGAALDAARIEFRPAVHLAELAYEASADGALTLRLALGEAAVAAGAEQVRVELADTDGRVLLDERAAVDGRDRLELDFQAPAVRAWSPADPALYRLTVRLLADERTHDTLVQPIGFRSFEREPDGALRLNGAPLYLRGTTTIGCYWEAARHGRDDEVIEQLLLVKALFGNVLRVHVAVPPERLYALADRVGVLIYQDGPYQWHCFEPRADALDEELVQVHELARHVRNHPSVVVLSLPNEMHMKDAFHASDVAFVDGAAEILRRDLPGVVHLQDWSGGTRSRALPQAVHDYPGYFYATTGAQEGILDAGGDQLDPGVRVIVSEYGGGAIASWQAMLDSRAAHELRGETIELPADQDGPWTAEANLYGMTGEMLRSHQRVVGWRPSFEAYRIASGQAQARVLTRQTGRLRRDRGRVSGVIQHYLQNPAPLMYNPWVDLHVIDSAGVPTAGFTALRDALRPVAVEITGLPARTYGGQPLEATAWVCNDLPSDADIRLDWSWTDAHGRVLAEGTHDRRVSAGAVEAVAQTGLETPQTDDITPAVLHASLSIDGREWVRVEERVEIHPLIEEWAGTVEVIGDTAALAARAGAWLPRIEPFSPDGSAPVLVTPEVPLDEPTIQVLLDARARARTVILLERRPGDDVSWVSPSTALAVAREQPVEVANVELSLTDSGLTTDDLSRWATPDGRVVTHPLMGIDRRGTPAWARCGHGLQLVALQEATYRGGLVLVCQLLVWSTLGTEPIAARVLRAMLDAPYRPI